jgi:hypothetical protein
MLAFAQRVAVPVWWHWSFIAAIVTAAVAFTHFVDPDPGNNLALGARVTPSSNDGTLPSGKGAADGDIWNVGFRTEREPSPSVMLDFGSVKAVSRFVIYNCYDRYPYPAIRPRVEFSLDAAEARARFDCRQENEVPLSIEVSSDGQAFTEVARRNQRFELWNVKVPPQMARYVRVRLLREGHLQLREIEVYR